MDESKIDCEGTDEIVCPYCGHMHSDSWEMLSEAGCIEQVECIRCGQAFDVEVRHTDVATTYYSEKMPHA